MSSTPQEAKQGMEAVELTQNLLPTIMEVIDKMVNPPANVVAQMLPSFPIMVGQVLTQQTVYGILQGLVDVALKQFVETSDGDPDALNIFEVARSTTREMVGTEPITALIEVPEVQG